MMKVIFNRNDLTEFLSKGLPSNQYDIHFEEEFKDLKSNKAVSRIKAFLNFVSKNDSPVLLFSIENILVIDFVFRAGMNPVVWLWNPISSMNLKNRLLFLFYVRLKNIRVWTFDKEDSEKYGFHFHYQIHSDQLIKQGGLCLDQCGGAFFSGVDKGRFRVLKEIQGVINASSLSSDFHIVRDRRGKYTGSDLYATTDKYLSYDEYLERVHKCLVIVDVPQKSQKGVTLRVIESFLLGKKLVTTNDAVVNLPGYRVENVYVFGKEKRSFSDFLCLPYFPLSNDIKKMYTINHLLDEVFLEF